MMESIMKLVRMTVASGILALLSMFISVLALNDLAHGEGDVTLEWGAVRVTALIILIFVTLSLVTLRKAVHELRNATLTQPKDQ